MSLRWERKRKESNRMAYAEIKGRFGGATGCREWAISGTAQAPSTTERQAPRPGEDTVYSPTKYRETEGIKDVKSDSYSPSWYQQIDNSQWEDYGNAQGADRVIKQYTGTVRLPRKPDRVTSVYGTYTGQSKFVATGDKITVVASNPNLYDCTTWRDYPDPDQYQYYGYKESLLKKTEETVTVLAQSGSTAMQNFAFDMDEEDL